MGGQNGGVQKLYCMRLPSTAILTCTQSYRRDCNLVIMIVSKKMLTRAKFAEKLNKRLAPKFKVLVYKLVFQHSSKQ